MKFVKFVLLALGVAFAAAVFLPYIKVGSSPVSLWDLGSAAKLAGESATPVYLVLATGLALAALAAAGVARKQFGRLAALGGLILSCATFFFTVKMGAPSGGILKAGLVGAHIIVFGSLLGLLISLLGLIKPDRT